MVATLFLSTNQSNAQWARASEENLSNSPAALYKTDEGVCVVGDFLINNPPSPQSRSSMALLDTANNQWKYISTIPTNNNQWGYTQTVVNFKQKLYIGGNYSENEVGSYFKFLDIDGVFKVVPNGPSDIVSTMLEFGGQLYLGTGSQGGVGKNSAPNSGLQKFDGVDFSDVGGGELSGYVTKLFVYKEELYVFGNFQVKVKGGYTVQNVVKWNGTEFIDANLFLYGWNPIGVTVHNGDLYVTGAMQGNNETLQVLLKKVDNEWEVITSTNYPGDQYYSLASYNGDLYLGGFFGSIGGVSANNIARLSNSLWYSVGSGKNNTVRSLLSVDSTLYASGYFSEKVSKWTLSKNTTGVQNNFANTTPCTAYPNPFTDKVVVEISSDLGKIHNLVLYNILGTEVGNINGTSRIVIDGADLEKGLFVYRVFDDKKQIVATGRIVHN